MDFLNKEWRDMNLGELWFAWAYWNNEVKTYPCWGAGLVVANSFRAAAENELCRRGDWEGDR